MKWTASLFFTSLLLVGCQTAPIVQPKVLQSCPKIPQLELSLPMGALELSFLDRTQNFLSGKLPEPISYELRSKPASPTPPKLNAN